MVHTRLMALSGPERFLMAIRMCEAARRMVLASLPAGLLESDRKRLLFERLYGAFSASLQSKIVDCPLSHDPEKSKDFVEAGAEVYAKA